MPSDSRIAQVLALLAPQIAAYRSAVAATLEDLRGRLASHAVSMEIRAAQFKKELGAFADGRIDSARLAGVAGEKHELAPEVLDRLQRASQVLHELADQGEELFCLTVAPGQDLVAAVRERFALIGRAFAAARLAAVPSDDSPLLALQYEDWSAAERRLGPPLAVSVQGCNLRVAGLAEFLDGTQKIVLVVNGPCSPAPLVRLITPAVLVVQAHDASECEAIATWPGTAIGAVLPATSAVFVHDPAAGPEAWQRLTVKEVPEATSLSRLGGLSAFQQTEELRQLETLAREPARAAGAPGEATGSDPVDRLAAWLLQQTNLSDGGGD